MPTSALVQSMRFDTPSAEKGLVDPATLSILIDTYETKVGPRNGAKVIARAWTDPAYKQRLLTDAGAAIAEIEAARRGGDSDLGDTYYHHWLAALEGMVQAKGIVDAESLSARKTAWEDAVAHTPHGKPILLPLHSNPPRHTSLAPDPVTGSDSADPF